MLMILDGFGYREDFYGNAIMRARTPVLDEIFDNYPFITIYFGALPINPETGNKYMDEIAEEIQKLIP